MQESMEKYKAAGINKPILLGGAALTQKFVAKDCVPQYDAPVVYCRDAFSGLKAIQDFEKGKLKSSSWKNNKHEKESTESIKKSEVTVLDNIPEPPFTGIRTLDVTPAEFLPLLNQQILFRGRWGYKRGKLDDAGYKELLETTVLPEFNALKERILKNNLLKPKIRYGWFPCRRDEESLIVSHEDATFSFPLPRQRREPNKSLVDFYRTEEQGNDLIGFFVVTLGDQIASMCHKLYAEDKYHEYLLTHGFGVETAEALAQYTHNLMREELQIRETGQRYSFGYSACPELDLQQPLFELLKANEIGVNLSSSMEMVPELSVSAMVVHHPQAHYFAV
jgi:5-methyltetrahydrofolate--homocysteine methyltransferase